MGSFTHLSQQEKHRCKKKNHIYDGRNPFSRSSFQSPVSYGDSLSPFHGLLGHVNRTGPSLSSLVTTVFFLPLKKKHSRTTLLNCGKFIKLMQKQNLSIFITKSAFMLMIYSVFYIFFRQVGAVRPGSDLCRRLMSSSLEATLKKLWTLWWDTSFHRLLTLLHFISKSNLTLCQRQSVVSVHKFTSCNQPRQWNISVLGPCNRGLFVIRIIIQHFCFSVSPPRVCVASLRRCSLVLNGPCRVAKKKEIWRC